MAAQQTDYESYPVPNTPVDPEMAEVWELAGWIGDFSADRFRHTYATLMLAMLNTKDPASRWLQGYADVAQIRVAVVERSVKFPTTELKKIAELRDKGERPPKSKEDSTTSARGVFEEAASLLNELGQSLKMTEHTLGVRHLIAAYIYGIEHNDDLVQWGFQRDDWSNYFLGFIDLNHAQELDFWKTRHKSRFRAEPNIQYATPRPLSGYASDDPAQQTQDWLQLDDDVYALSSLVAASAAVPPLAIGLFGDWGAGKSFFMRQLQKRVATLAETARKSEQMQKDIGFCKHIVQIDFNAWQYAEGNLWASLVEHIFSQLATRGEADEVEKMQKHWLIAMQSREKELQEATLAVSKSKHEVDVAETKRAEAERQFKQRESDLKQLQNVDVLNASLDDLKQPIEQTLQAVGLDSSVETLRDAIGTLREVRTVLVRGLGIWTPLVRSPDAKQRLAMLLVVLGAPAILAIVGRCLAQTAMVPSVVALATFLGSGVAWLTQQAKWLSDRMKRAEELERKVRNRVAKAREKQASDQLMLEANVERAKQELANAQQVKETAEQALQEAQAELERVNAASVVGSFIRERSESQDYRKLLGVIDLVRRDFDKLSKLIQRDWNELRQMNALEEEQNGDATRINRIVLYIDDLDRCSEAKVIEVLEAVHLLLALPLFVVVVGVDARWLSRSLLMRYQGLLASQPASGPVEQKLGLEDSATPQDYLEKIFQIPFWLKPVTQDGSKRMLEQLLRPTGGASVSPPVKIDTPRRDAGNGVPPAEPDRISIKPVGLEVDEREIDFMAKLHPMIGRTPRSVRRFANTYRLIRAGLKPAQLRSYLEERGPLVTDYRVVLFLLSVLVGAPELSSKFFRALVCTSHDARVSQKCGVPAALANGASNNLQWLFSNLADNSEMSMLRSWLNDYSHEVNSGWAGWPIDPLRVWAPSVARYSFRIERI